MVSLYILSKSYYCCRLRLGCFIISIIDVLAAITGILVFTLVNGIEPENAKLMIAAAVFCLVAGILLVVGTFIRNFWVLVACVILAIIAIIICFVTVFLFIPYVPWWLIFLSMFPLLLSVYHWMITFSYTLALKSGDGTSDASGEEVFGIFQRISL